MRKLVLMVLVLTSVNLSAQVLSLEECRAKALEHNQSLRMAKESKEAAAQLKKAAQTQFLPNFSMNGSYVHTSKEYQLLNEDMFLPIVPYNAIDPATGNLNSAALSDPSVAANTFVFNPVTGAPVTTEDGSPVFQDYAYLPASESKIDMNNLFILQAGFVQPVYTGGLIRENYKIAGYTENMATQSVEVKSDEVLYTIDEVYWRIVALKEKVKLTDKYESMLITLVRDLKNIYEEGMITENDLLKARVKLNEIELKKLKAQNGLELSKMQMCQLIGEPYHNGLEVSDSSVFVMETAEKDDYKSQALENRNELKLLEESINIANSGEKIMKSRFMPNIGLTAGYVMTNPNPYNGLTNDFGGDLNVGVVCNIPIFHFGEKQHTLRAAKHKTESANLRLEETKELIGLQVQQVIFSYSESCKKVEMARLNLEQADKNLALNRDNFDEGIYKTRDLLEAQASWQNAYSELIDAKTEQQLNNSKLKLVTGTL